MREKRKEGRAHTSLQHWLIDLAKTVKDGPGQLYYRSYSGDSEALDIRVRDKHITYEPDVVWERNGKKWTFELAFTEDWRAVAGEITLAALGRCSEIVILTRDWEPTEFTTECVRLLRNEFWDKYGLWADALNLTSEELKDISRSEKRIEALLRRWKFVW